MGYVSRAIVIAAFCFGSSAFAANLLRNGSFEDTPCATPCMQTQAVMPSGWVALTPGLYAPDTWSADGSFGVSPLDYGKYPSATAQDGIRWMGGYSFNDETFGQVLGAPLMAGQGYTLSGYVRQALRKDPNHSGTVQVELWSTPDAGASKIVLGSFPQATSSTSWLPGTISFVAPPNAASYSVIAFHFIASGTDTAYTDLDNVVLDATAGGSGGGGQCATPNSVPRIVIDGCETGVINRFVGNGCTIADAVGACQASAGGNHGDFVSCVAALTNSLQKSNLITGQEKGQIQSCAAQAR